MKKLDEPGVETLLKQLELTQPSASLDESIGELFENKTPSVFQPANRFGYRELCGVAMVALLLGGVIGFMAGKDDGARFSSLLMADSDVPSTFTTVAFNQLHGHSQSAQYSDCSACHKFSSAEDQQLNRWRFGQFHDTEVRDQLGVPDCSNCHGQPKEELGPDPHDEILD